MSNNNSVCINTINVCCGGSCESLGASKIIAELNSIIRAEHLKHIEVKVFTKKTGCHGFCEAGPIVVVKPADIFYTKVKPSDARDIIDSVLNGTIVERLLFEGITYVSDIPFYNSQTRYLLRRTGEIDPFHIDEFLETGGFEGLKIALTKTPAEVIAVVKESGLRGRGGGGFSTGVKWTFLAKAGGDKVLIANADEGDPGSFMDRTLMEGDPYSVIEGMLIAAYATGANEGHIYVRAEYPEAVRMLNNAIDTCYKKKYLGKNILGKDGFNFELDTFLGAGAFVCGEETALLNSMEGKRGMPRQKPPFPAEKGLFGKPTNINNVKSYSYVTHILREGPESFNKYGTEKSPGTAVLSLTGKIKHTGIVEVPMGTSLKDLIFKIGGGLRDNKKIKAVLTGGPSGGAIPANMLNIGVDYESLTAVGSIMGSGGVLVLDEDDSMPEIAEFFIEFCKEESCGKCVPCREGTYRLKEILERINNSKGTKKDIEELKRLSHYVKDAAVCGLGQTAPNPILTSLKYFEDEYVEKIESVGKTAIYEIHDNCIGCGACKRVCPVDTIEGNPKEHHFIHQEKCIHCGACFKICPVKAISKRYAVVDENNVEQKEGSN